MHSSSRLLCDNRTVSLIYLVKTKAQKFNVSRFQPETLPAIEANNRENTFIIYKPLVPIIGNQRGDKSRVTSKKIPRNPFLLFLNPDVDVLLMISALTCAVFYAVLATISSLFVTVYPFLSETTIGLCFLAMGGGMAVGSSVIGRILDLEYRRLRKKIEVTATSNQNLDEMYPLEYVGVLLY